MSAPKRPPAPLQPALSGQDSVHTDRVASRQADLMASGRPKLRTQAILDRAPSQARQRLLDLALQGPAMAQRILWLRLEADMVVQAAAGVAPCAQGCSHCCHLPVDVAEPEAQAIGKAIGYVPLPPPQAKARSQSASQFEDPSSLHYGVPCPFLGEDGACSIYEIRPLACRNHIVLDDDDLLCQLAAGAQVQQPVLTRYGARYAYAQAMGPAALVADIREWFAPGAP